MRPTSVTGSNTTTYAWDYENRLSSVTLPGSGGTVSFKYDPFGRRIYKSSSSATSIYAYDGDNLVEEANAAGAVVARYSQTQNIDEPLAMLRAGATSYYHADGLGSVTSLSNAAGSIANTYTYDSFGKLTASTGSLTNTFRYTAREFDAESNLYFLRARYYDQSTGRFLSEDPIGFEGGFNLYEYGEDNPTDLSDPFGWQSTIPPGCSPPFLTPCGPPMYGPPLDTTPPKPPAPPVPGWWPGSGPGSGSGPKPRPAPSPSPQRGPIPAPGGNECDDKGPECTKASPFQLRNAGISDEHSFKQDYFGKKAPVSRYDICACKDGSIVIKLRGQCGKPGPTVDTGRTWK